MAFDSLWAGWRGDYVASVPGESEIDRSEPGCVFCRILASGESDEVSLIVHRRDQSFAILNVYPYGTGHLMVMPLRHVAKLHDLTTDEMTELWSMVSDGVEVLRKVYKPDGFNIGMNLGRTAGAGIPDHLHVHALPRWSGDTSFMTSVANTRVMPEALDVTWRKVSEAWSAHNGRR